MAYTSDLRIKSFIKDVDVKVRHRLEAVGFQDRLFLRIFDESKEDAKLWRDGGLSFEDVKTKMHLGSNDAAWSIDNKIPVVVVEGTYGTERGQFGDGQLNRASHSYGVAVNGYIGVMLVPYKGQSFVKDGSRKDILVKNVNYAHATLHKGMVKLALEVSKDGKGKFLIIDPYEDGLLEDLIYNVVLDYFNKPNKLKEIVTYVLKEMEDYLGTYVFGARSKQVIRKLYNAAGKIISRNSRFYTQNLEALTTSTKRDGHGLLGKNLIEMHTSSEKIYSIFIRLDKDDLKVLQSRDSKEFQFLLNNPKIEVRCFNDLIFEDAVLKKQVVAFRTQNLHQETEKELIGKIQEAFNVGKIKIKE